MIRHVFLDVDNTILDFNKAEAIALEKTLSALSVPHSPEVIRRYSQLNLAQWKLLEQGKLTREQVKVRRYRLLFDELKTDASPEEAARIYEGLLGQGHYFMDGAVEMLQALYGSSIWQQTGQRLCRKADSKVQRSNRFLNKSSSPRSWAATSRRLHFLNAALQQSLILKRRRPSWSVTA
mgnify:CR=1 FL=1